MTRPVASLLKPPPLAVPAGKKLWAGYLFIEGRGTMDVFAGDAILLHACGRNVPLSTLSFAATRGAIAEEGAVLLIGGDFADYLGVETGSTTEVRIRIPPKSEQQQLREAGLEVTAFYILSLAAVAPAPGALADPAFWQDLSAVVRSEILDAQRPSPAQRLPVRISIVYEKEGAIRLILP